MQQVPPLRLGCGCTVQQGLPHLDRLDVTACASAGLGSIVRARRAVAVATAAVATVAVASRQPGLMGQDTVQPTAVHFSKKTRDPEL